MEKRYKELLDQLDDLMIALTKQKRLGLDAEVVKALRNLTKARNAFKREFLKTIKPVDRPETVFTNFLDILSDNVRP